MNHDLWDSHSRRPVVLLLLMGFTGVVAIGYCYQTFQESRRAAIATAQDAVEVQRLTKEILRRRDRPRLASLEVEPPDRISTRVREAVKTASLKANAVVSVEPQTPSRVGRSSYQLRATQIVLRDVTMKQLMLFSLALRDAQSGMGIRDVSLSPRLVDSASEEHWDVSLTLTQMIFSPISKS